MTNREDEDDLLVARAAVLVASLASLERRTADLSDWQGRTYPVSEQQLRTEPLYDPECEKLAEYFLTDVHNVRPGQKEELAQHIQDAIETWLYGIK